MRISYFNKPNKIVMKNSKILILAIVGLLMFVLSNCGPVLITSRPHHPTPPWFYPNRVETVRYIYFPDHYIYYDLSLRTYLYLDNGVWISANILPSRFNRINLRRSRTVRINNYFGDDIRRYHKENNGKIRSRRNTSTRRNN